MDDLGRLENEVDRMESRLIERIETLESLVEELLRDKETQK